jgi:two-component system response regulator YesN
MLKVLLVDDEKAIAEGIQKIIAGFALGFDDFRIAGDGQEALEQLDEYQPDVIITDIRMIYLDGLALCEKIRQRKDAFRDIPILVISGYSDFNYARTAIKYNVFGYILKPIDKRELLEHLQKVKLYLEAEMQRLQSMHEHHLMNEELLFRLLCNSETTEEETGELFLEAGVTLQSFKTFYLVALYNKSDRDSLMQSNFSGSCKKYFIQLVKDLGNNGYKLLCSMDVNKLLLGMFGEEETAKNSFAALLADFNGRNKSGDGKLLLVGDPFVRMTQIREVYFQIRSLYKNRRLLYDRVIATYDNVKKRKKEGSVDLKEIHSILQAVRVGDIKTMMAQFDILKDYIDRNEVFTIDYIEGIYKSICMEIHKYFYSQWLARFCPEVLDRLLNAHSLIESTRSLSELHSEVRSLVLDFATAYISSERKDESLDIVETVKRYVLENYYDSAMSLQNIADKLGISTSFLSTQFKKGTGFSFNDYLTQIRMNKAAELLKQNKLSVLDISRRVGYISDKHFFVVFKKYFNITPAKYGRKASLEKNFHR